MRLSRLSSMLGLLLKVGFLGGPLVCGKPNRVSSTSIIGTWAARHQVRCLALRLVRRVAHLLPSTAFVADAWPRPIQPAHPGLLLLTARPIALRLHLREELVQEVEHEPVGDLVITAHLARTAARPGKPNVT